MVRKSRKHYKSKSKKRQIKKNKFSKNKTRKIRGGTNENNDYIFVGVHTNSTMWDHGRKFININDIAGIPIFLPNNNTLKNNLPGRIVLWFGTGDISSFNLHLLLPVLYKLNYRGLNFEVLSTRGANGRQIFFYDNNETPVLDYNTLKKKIWPTDYKDQIKNIELKYPGLFQRMYITEEEERQALEALERKGNQKNELNYKDDDYEKDVDYEKDGDYEQGKVFNSEM